MTWECVFWGVTFSGQGLLNSSNLNFKINQISLLNYKLWKRLKLKLTIIANFAKDTNRSICSGLSNLWFPAEIRAFELGWAFSQIFPVSKNLPWREKRLNLKYNNTRKNFCFIKQFFDTFWLRFFFEQIFEETL